jgi:hypothetical protein
MTTYTDPTTLNTDPNDPVTSVLLTALKDNPVAVVEGAAGAPKVSAAAMGVLIFADSATVTANNTTTLTSDGDLTRVDNVVVLGNISTSTPGGSNSTAAYSYRLSSDGGASWGGWVVIDSISSSGGTFGQPFIATIDTSSHDTIQTRMAVGNDAGSDTGTVAAYCIGVQGAT